MKTSNQMLCSLVLVIAGCQSQAPEPALTFTEFSPKDGRCSILMPGTPDHEQEEIADGPTIQHRFKVEAGGCLFTLHFTPWNNEGSLTDEEVLEDGAKPIVETGYVKEKKKLNLGGFPGMELVIVRPRGMDPCRFRTYIAKDRHYILMVIGPEPAIYGANAERYFASFKVTK